jgi:periplasmic protein TonB
MEFLTSLGVSQAPIHRRWAATTVSVVAHALAIATAVLLPILAYQPLPVTATGSLSLFRYDPPPPPPLPPPLGSGLLERARPALIRPAEPEAAIEAPNPEMTAPPTPAIPREQANDEASGSATGRLSGVPEGMEGGVERGMVGGVPDGVVDGAIGGVGKGPVAPVLDYDQGPRLLRQARPDYPHEAFTKKIEGIVVVEILIDDTGHVARMRILQSVPPLDDAALDAVRQWFFRPAMRHGRPVATIAVVPVRFTIY